MVKEKCFEHFFAKLVAIDHSIALAGYGILFFLGFADMGLKSRTKWCRLDGALNSRTSGTKERTERSQIVRFYVITKFRGRPWLQKRF